MAAQIYTVWLKQLLWQSAMLLSPHLQLYGVVSIFKLYQALYYKTYIEYKTYKTTLN